MKNSSQTLYIIKVYLENGEKDSSPALFAPEVRHHAERLNKENASYIIQKIIPDEGDAPDEGELVNVSLSEV